MYLTVCIAVPKVKNMQENSSNEYNNFTTSQEQTHRTPNLPST